MKKFVFLLAVMGCGWSLPGGVENLAQDLMLRISATPALRVFYPGDVPTLFLEFRNASDQDQVRNLPYRFEREQHVFPSDLFLTKRDNEVLPLARNPEIRIFFPANTTLKPGETMLLEVPLSLVARLPDMPRGTYEVELLAGYYRGGTTPIKDISLRIEASIPAEGAETLPSILAMPTWKEGVKRVPRGVAPGVRPIVDDKAQPPWVRSRALAVFIDDTISANPACDVHVLVDLLEMALHGDNVQALSLMDHVKSLGEAHRKTIWMAGLRHPDLGVRRQAARNLAGAILSRGEQDHLRERLKDERDELLVGLIKSNVKN